ncbi:Biotin synthase, partial [Pseudomonas syringae pv. maculicola]
MAIIAGLTAHGSSLNMPDIRVAPVVFSALAHCPETPRSRPMSASTTATLRHDWTLAEVRALFVQPFNDLLFQAQTLHRAHFDANRVQVSTLLSIKTGACPEDCKYCPQSGHYNTGLEKEKLLEVQKVLEEAARAKSIGSTRFCMGAAWKHPSAKDMPYVLEMVKGVKAMGLET